VNRADTLSAHAQQAGCANTDEIRGESGALTESTSVILPALSAQSSGWRVEVQKRGRYWQWRKGRAQNRQARYGGKFELLTEERKAQYAKNIQMRQTRKMQEPTTDNGTRSIDAAGIGGELLPTSGLASKRGEWQ